MIIGVNSSFGFVRVNNELVYMRAQELRVLELLFDNRTKIVRYKQIENAMHISILDHYKLPTNCRTPKIVPVVIYRIRRRFIGIFQIDNVCSDGSIAGNGNRDAIGYRLTVNWPRRAKLKKVA